MNSLLAELGKRAAERWLRLLVLPGALFLAVVAAGVLVLGHDRWYEVGALLRAMNGMAAKPRSTGQTLLLAVLFSLGAGGVGLAAQALGGGVERLWLTPGRNGVGRWLTARRRARWSIADAAYRDAVLHQYAGGASGDLDALLRERDRICPVEPDRPTWIGDRIRAADERIHRTYDVDFAAAWPRLWLCVPDAARIELAAAQAALSAEARLLGWGLLYVVPAVWWWPSAAIAAITCVVAWWRGRAAGAVLADLAESAFDLYGRDLADQLGVACAGRFTAQAGLDITRIVRKDG